MFKQIVYARMSLRGSCFLSTKNCVWERLEKIIDSVHSSVVAAMPFPDPVLIVDLDPAEKVDGLDCDSGGVLPGHT